MSKSKIIIFTAVFVIILAVAATLLLARRGTDSQVPLEASPAQTPSPLPEDNQPGVYYPQEPDTEKIFELEEQSANSLDFLNNNPEILASVKNIKGDFVPNDIGVSPPAKKTWLGDGREILLLSGCQPRNCGGTGTIIAHDGSSGKAYLLIERVGSALGYEFFGNPPEEIKDLLLYYFFNR